jgi:hypothetical protein
MISLTTLLPAQGATPAQADSLVAAAATYDNSRTPMTPLGLMINGDSVVVVDSVEVMQYTPDNVDSLWAVVQACSGVTAPADALDGITFNAVPGDAFYVHAEERHLRQAPDIGFTVLEHNNILIVKKYRNRPSIVKHEMLHALLYITATVRERPWHRQPYFGDCGLSGQ